MMIGHRYRFMWRSWAVMLAANCSDAETEKMESRPLGRIVSFVKIKFQTRNAQQFVHSWVHAA